MYLLVQSYELYRCREKNGRGMKVKLQVELTARCCGREMNHKNVIDVDTKKRSTYLECEVCMRSIEVEGINVNMKESHRKR